MDDWDAPAHSFDGRLSASGDSAAPHGPHADQLRDEHAGRLLGNGGQGLVLAGHDRHLPREVAWKVALRDDELGRTRLRHEAHVLARLEHPGIVPIYDLVDDGRDVRMATRFIRGHTLRVHLNQRQRGSEGRLLRHLLAVAHAIAYSHERGVIHRDLKPDNVMIGDHGETLVIDWGLAQTEDDPLEGLVGTAAYMSPEQARGERVGPPADVWSLGVMLLEILGHPLWAELSLSEIQSELRLERIPSLPPLPREVAAIVTRSLAPAQELRYPDARAFAQDLEAYLDGRRVAAHTYSLSHRARLFWKRHRVVFAIGLTTLIVVGIGLPILWTRITAEQDEAAAAHAERLRVFIESETTRATIEHKAGRRAEAELAAIRVLEQTESPQARGVLAAWSRVPRPTTTSQTQAPSDCTDSELSPDGRLFVCGRRESLEVIRLEDRRPLLRNEGAYFGVALADDALWLSAQDNRYVIDRLPLDGGPRSSFEACGRLLKVAAAGRLLDWGAPCAAVIERGAVHRRLPIVGRLFQTAALTPNALVTLDTAGEVVASGPAIELSFPTPLASSSRDWTVSAATDRMLLLGSTRGQIARVDLTSGRTRIADSPIISPIKILRTDPQGQLLLVHYDDASTRLLTTSGLAPVLQLPGTSKASWFNPTGELLTLTDQLTTRTLPHGHIAALDGLIGVTSARLEGHELIVTHQHTASVIDVRNGATLSRFEEPQHIAKRALRRGMELIVAFSVLTPASLHTHEAGGLLARPLSHARRLESLPDGRLVVGSSGAELEVEAPDGSLFTFAVQRSADLAVEDFEVAVLDRPGTTLRLWDLRGGPVELSALPVGAAGAVALIRRPDGLRFILAHPDHIEALHLDGSADRVWFAPGLVPSRVVALDRAGSSFVAAGTRSGEVLVWRWDGRLVARVAQHTEAVSSLSIDDTGRWLVSGAWDGRVRFLDLDVLDAPRTELVTAVRAGWSAR